MQGGYGYLIALTQAIEAWSAAVIRTTPDAFMYRGANLRYAAERSLFFELVHDVGLRAKFLADATGKLDVKVPPINIAKRLRYEVGNLSRLFRPPFVTARLRGRADFLFLTIHPKFVTFLQPVADTLEGAAAYFTVEDWVTEAHLAKLSLSAVAVRPAFTRHGIPRGVLSHFASLCRSFDQISAMLTKIKPKVIVVPEGNAPIYEVAHRAGSQHGVATVCLQHGAPAYTNPGFRNWTFENMLVWGPQFIEPFEKYNPRQRFTPVGTPATFGTPRLRGRDPIHRIGFFLQKAAENIPVQEWEAMLKFISWAARTFPEVEMVIREHPTQPRFDAAELALLGTPANLRFMSPPEFGLSEVLSICDVVVAGASTTLFEAIATGAIPFVFGTAFSPDFPQIASEGAAVAAATLDAAKQAMVRLVEDADMRARLREQGSRLCPELFACFGQEGAVRIGEALRRAAADLCKIG